MAHHVVIDNFNKVVNVIELEEGAEWSPPNGCQIIKTEEGAIGDIYDGTSFIKPVQSQEETV